VSYSVPAVILAAMPGWQTSRAADEGFFRRRWAKIYYIMGSCYRWSLQDGARHVPCHHVLRCRSESSSQTPVSAKSSKTTLQVHWLGALQRVLSARVRFGRQSRRDNILLVAQLGNTRPSQATRRYHSSTNPLDDIVDELPRLANRMQESAALY
jgi:hypothetical protein